MKAPPNHPAAGPAVSRPRPDVAQATEAVVGEEYIDLIQPFLERLHQAYPHPNRVLHYDAVLTALLLGFYNSSVRSLRTLEAQSQNEGFIDLLPNERICRSTLSDAMRQMDAKSLLPLVQQLAAKVPALKSTDGDLHALMRRIIAADGSVFTVPADVMWAIALSRSNGKAGRQFRLNLQLDVLHFLPTTFSISGDQDGSESAAFMRDLVAGVIYVADRNFVDFKFIHAVFDIGSDLVVRLKSDTKFVALEERAISDADREANVVSDRIGLVPGSPLSPGFGDKRLREVVLIDPRSGRPVRLLTNLLDLPARIIGLIYRHRWMIELFFKWLKCTANLRHLLSESPNGIAMQLYVAVIAVLLMYLRTGRRPSVYAALCLSLVSSGQMSVETMLKILERSEREKELDRAARARRQAKKNQA